MVKAQKSKGIALIVTSAFFYALMSVFVSKAGDLPFFEKVLFRNLVSTAVAAWMLIKKHVPLRVSRDCVTPLIDLLPGSQPEVVHLVIHEMGAHPQLGKSLVEIAANLIQRGKIRTNVVLCSFLRYVLRHNGDALYFQCLYPALQRAYLYKHKNAQGRQQYKQKRHKITLHKLPLSFHLAHYISEMQS